MVIFLQMQKKSFILFSSLLNDKKALKTFDIKA